MEGTLTTRNGIEVQKWDCRRIADKLGDNTESSNRQDFLLKEREQGNLFFTLDALVSLDHSYRKLDRLLSFGKLSLGYRELYLPKRRKKKE